MDTKEHEWLPTRWSLLSRLKDWDDQESWRRFFDTYWQLIYGAGLKAGLTHSEAEEVVQDVVITVAKKIGSFKTEASAGSFKSWLLKLTRWRISDQFRKRGRSREGVRALHADTTRTGTVERVPDPAPGRLEAEWEAEWQEHVIQASCERVKSQVKPELFQIFDLLVYKQWPALKVARRLHVNLARVYYARCKVAALVKREINRLERDGI